MDLFALPLEILCMILSKWLSVYDLRNLDISVAETDKRKALLNMYASKNFEIETNSKDYVVIGYELGFWGKLTHTHRTIPRLKNALNFVQWLTKRNISVQHMNLDLCYDLSTVPYDETVTDESLNRLWEGRRMLQSISLKNLTDRLQITDQSLSNLPTELQSLTLHTATRNNFTDRGLQYVSVCSHLKSFTLNGNTHITDNGMKTMSEGCSNLEHLTLTTQITGECFQHLSQNCKMLKTLDLNSCSSILIEFLSQIWHYFPNLTTLKLSDIRHVTDDCFQHLSSFSPHLTGLQCCPMLTTLYLDNCSLITDTSLQHLSRGCPCLTILSLINCKLISDLGLQHLSQGCTQLTTLTLHNCVKISDDGLYQLSQGCTQLTNLMLKNCELISDNGLEHLSLCCRRLLILNLTNWDGGQFTSNGLLHLSKGCTDLECLFLWSSVNDESLKFLSRGCRKLQKLDLRVCRNLTYCSIKILAECCTKLQSLELRGCLKITDACLNHLSKHCSLLEYLGLGLCAKVTQKGVKYLSDGCKQLKYLELQEIKNINDNCLKYLSEGCIMLEELQIFGCDKVTETGIRHITDSSTMIHKLILACSPANRCKILVRRR